jgi:tRNA modification GTPase
MDTIAAISTAPGAAALSIVRVTGDDAIRIGAKIFRGREDLALAATHTAHYGWVMDPDTGEPLDEVLALVMREPRTYTREDTVEFNCHGGDAAPQTVLGALLRAGARLAEPGEFTRRAFLSGRIDLSQAEAVADIIGAAGRAALSQAHRGLRGELGQRLGESRTALEDVLVYLQAGIDYPEEDLAVLSREEVAVRLNQSLHQLQRLVEGAGKARMLRDGATVVIVGRPNVGKSSLFNLLSGKGRALVDATPGTTRDVLESPADLDGFFVYLSDTAGIRQSTDRLETAGVALAMETVHQADLILWVIDGAAGLTEADLEVFRQLPAGPVFLAINKIDLLDTATATSLAADLKQRLALRGAALVSAKAQSGVEDLIGEMAGFLRQGGLQDALLANLRQAKLAEDALINLQGACRAFAEGLPEDIIAVELEAALAFLGEITGDNVNDQVVHSIFHRFCVGK